MEENGLYDRINCTREKALVQIYDVAVKLSKCPLAVDYKCDTFKIISCLIWSFLAKQSNGDKREFAVPV